MKKTNKAYVAAVLYTIIIGLSFMFVKVTLTVSTPLDTLAHRFSVAFIGATLFLIISKHNLHITANTLKKVLPLAILYPILFFAFQVFGLAKISSSEAGIINATVPIFTLLFAILFIKERTTLGQLLFVCLSVTGVIYIFIMNGSSQAATNIIGSLFIALSAMTVALYNVFARKVTQQFDLLTITYVMTTIGFIIFNTVAIGNHMIEGTINEFFLPFQHSNFIIAILYLGILSSLMTSFLSNYALSQIEAAKMSVFSNLATLITIVAGVVFLKEPFYYYHIIGGLFILAGVIGTNRLKQR